MPFLPAMNNMLIHGTITPTMNIGQERDMYLNTNDKMLYGPKKNSQWPLMGRVVKSSFSSMSTRTMILIGILIFLIMACTVAYYMYRRRSANLKL